MFKSSFPTYSPVGTEDHFFWRAGSYNKALKSSKIYDFAKGKGMHYSLENSKLNSTLSVQGNKVSYSTKIVSEQSFIIVESQDFRNKNWRKICAGIEFIKLIKEIVVDLGNLDPWIVVTKLGRKWEVKKSSALSFIVWWNNFCPF